MRLVHQSLGAAKVTTPRIPYLTVRVKFAKKKGALRCLGHHAQAQAQHVVDAGAMAGDGRLDRRLQSPIADGQGRTGVAGSPLVERKLLRQRRDVVVWGTWTL